MNINSKLEAHHIVPRRPFFKFENADIHWAPNIEFAQIMNASSTGFPYLEPFLNKLMRRASPHLDHRPDLQKDIENFVAQEGNHYRIHKKFNKKLLEKYPGVAALEEQLEKDYQEFLEKKSLRFNAAYVEGFESLGPPYATFWYDVCEKYITDIDGANEEVVLLWKWHLAEEYEHRTVAYDVYKELFGKDIVGYFYRIFGFVYAFRHLTSYGDRVAKHLLKQDRQGMTKQEIKASKKRERTIAWEYFVYNFPKLIAVFSPFYTPHHKPEPKGAREILKRFEEAGPV